MDLAQPRWKTSQSDRLHLGETALSHISEHCQDTKLSRSKPRPTRIKFYIEKLKDPDVTEAFKAMIGGTFAPLIILDDKDTDVNLLTNTFNKMVTDTASEILGKHRRTKKPWVTADILDLCDKRRELKRRTRVPGGAAQYREVNRKIKQDTRRAKDNWIAE